MKSELAIMLGKTAYIDGSLPNIEAINQAGTQAGAQINAATPPVNNATEGAVPQVQAQEGTGMGLMAGIPLALALMYLGNKTKGMGGKAWNSTMSALTRHPKYVPGYTEYMSKAQIPIGAAGGFSSPAERLAALDKIFLEIGKKPNSVWGGTQAALNAERSAVEALAKNTQKGPGLLANLWEEHGPKTLPGMLAAIGAGGVALNAGDIVSNAFGGGKRRGGAPIIVNS